MPYKPQAPEMRCTALSGWSVLTVEGADAAAFLHAQTMNDVRALPQGRWQWNGWLTPKGRVIALFALLHAAPGCYLLACPDVPAGELAAALRRFVFRSKLTLTADGRFAVAAGPAHPDAAGAAAAGVDGAFVLDLSAAGGVRTLWLLPAGDGRPGDAEPAVDAAWYAADLAHGLPRLGPAQREAWTPQMLSLGRLAAFSLRKGCYPGQEIVARTHYLGQAKRELVRLSAPGLGEGLAVHGDGRAVGTVICATAAGEGLAVLASDAPDQLTAGDGRALARLPLLDGLARA